MLANSKFWALLRRDYAVAGDLYYRDRRFARAADFYARAGRLEQAAEVALENGELQRAVELFVRAGRPRRAGEALVAAGDLRGAVAHFEAASDFLEAAKCSLKLGRILMAGRYYERGRAYRRAAECFDQAGESDSASRAWALEAERLWASGSDDTSARLELDQVNRTRSQILEGAGRFIEAAEVLTELGEQRKAAQLFERGRELTRAVECFVEAGSFADAARLLPQSKGVSEIARAKVLYHTGGYEAAATLFEQLGHLEEAVEAYELAGKSQHAARLWEKLGFFASAASHYANAAQYMEAGACYEKADDFGAAARAYDEANALGEAARCHELAGHSLVAAERYLENGEEGEADRLLQAITPGDPDYAAATFLLLPLFIKDGLYEPALERLATLVVAQGGAAAAEKYYWEGRAHEGLGSYAKAAAMYRKVVSLQSDFRDVAQRLADVEIQDTLQTREFDPEMTADEEGGDQGGWWVRPGEVLAARYVVVREIGRGGMSRVYEALDRQIDERVAMKILAPRADDSRRMEDRLLQEVRICRQLSHPNVVKVFDFGRCACGVFITMELLVGETLEERIRERGPASLADTRALFDDIVQGLAEAHRRKVIHRDLKPMNIFLTPQGNKIMDFGIARIEDDDPKLTRTGHIIGSPLFMSPEQLRGQDIDHRSDLYSLGILVFYALTGKTPFAGRTSTELALKHLSETPPRLRDLRPDIPPAWESFVATLLQKKREERFASISEVAALLPRLPV